MSRTTFFTVLVAAGVSSCAREPEPARAPVSATDSAGAAHVQPAAAVDSAASPADTAASLAGPAPPPQRGSVPSAAPSPAPSSAPPAPTAQPVTPPARTPAPVASPDAPADVPEQDDGAAMLRRAAAAYENVRTLRADFEMRYTNPLLREQRTSRGKLYRQSPDRIALIFSDPKGDLIIGDGEFFYAYYPSNNPGQATRTPAGGGGSGVDLQAQFVGNPVERFDYTLHGTENVGGRPARVLTLVPKQRAEYRSLKVWLDTRDALARRFEIVELNGTIRHFDLTGMQVNGSLPDGVFRFTAPAGVRVITAG